MLCEIKINGQEQVEFNRQMVIDLHIEIEGCKGAMLSKMVECGRVLMELKETTPHGQWLIFCHKHLPFSVRTAQRYMSCYQNRDKYDTVSHLPLSKAIAVVEGNSRMERAADFEFAIERFMETFDVAASSEGLSINSTDSALRKTRDEIALHFADQDWTKHIDNDLSNAARAMQACEVLPFCYAWGRFQDGTPLKTIAKKLGVSHALFRVAVAVWKTGDNLLIDAFRSERVGIAFAEKLISLSEAERKTQIAEKTNAAFELLKETTNQLFNLQANFSRQCDQLNDIMDYRNHDDFVSIRGTLVKMNKWISHVIDTMNEGGAN